MLGNDKMAIGTQVGLALPAQLLPAIPFEMRNMIGIVGLMKQAQRAAIAGAEFYFWGTNMKTMKHVWINAGLLLCVTLNPIAVWAQRPDPVALMAAQKEAMSKLSLLDGVWRGSASTTLPNGDKHTVTQTERIGSLLGGTIKLIEGRGYDADGKTAFNAFGVVSFNVATKTYNFRTYAQGFVGDYAYQPTADGFSWEIPAGPMTMRYNAAVKNGEWRQTGDRVEPGKPPVRFLEMTLKRVSDSDWPEAGTIGPK